MCKAKKCLQSFLYFSLYSKQSAVKKILGGKLREISKDGFRYRGLQSSRLENLTDAVFGFSITLLVISSQVPQSYLELQTSMYGFFGFIFCTMLLLGLWDNHSNFFLHYGLQDSITKLLNALFLFVLLFYVYPLKYLFSYLGTAMYVRLKLFFGDRSDAMKLVLEQLQEADLNTYEWKDLTLRFGFGLFLIYLTLGLMHFNAYRKREELNLDHREVFITKTFMLSFFLLVLVCLISMLVVVIWGGAAAPYAGSVYLLIPVLLSISKRARRKRMNSI